MVLPLMHYPNGQYCFYLLPKDWLRNLTPLDARPLYKHKKQFIFDVGGPIPEPSEADLAPLWAKALQTIAAGGSVSDIIPDVLPYLLLPSASNISALNDAMTQRCELWAKLFPTFSGYNLI